MKTSVRFTKMVGAGNDFLIVDGRLRSGLGLKGDWRAVSRSLCDRRRGVGADGLLLLERSKSADVKMRIFNADGTEAEMCGNGARCVAVYMAQRGESRVRSGMERPVIIDTKAGLVAARVRGDRVSMSLPDPLIMRLDWSLEIEGHRAQAAFINTGVPHLVVPVKALDRVDVSRVGRKLRYHRHFAPRGTNVDFIQADPKRPNRLRVRTYERGVEEETPACGTGVAASAIAHALVADLRLCRSRAQSNGELPRHCRLEVETRSAEVLTVSLSVIPEGRIRRVSDVTLEGSASVVFKGIAAWPPRRS